MKNSLAYFFRNKVAAVFISFLSCSMILSAQEIINLPVQWSQPVLLNYDGESVLAPKIEQQELDNGKPVFYWKQKLKSLNYKIHVVAFEHSVAPVEDVNYLNEFSFQVTDSLSIETNVTNAGTEHFGLIYLFPYIKVGGVVHRINAVLKP